MAGSDHLERAKIYQSLHRDYLDRFNATRKIEWIINGALWAGVLLVGRQIAGHVDVANWSWFSIFIVAVLIGCCHFFFWMKPIQVSQNTDQKLARQYRLYLHLALANCDLELPPNRADRDRELEEAASKVPDASDNELYVWTGTGDMIWPLVECATTSVLVFVVITFLKLVPWMDFAK